MNTLKDINQHSKVLIIHIIIISLFITHKISYAQQQAPAIEWQKCFGGSTDDAANSIIHTADGGYAFAASASSNDGDVSGNHNPQVTTTDAYDVWVVKLDQDGRIEWQKCFGGTSFDHAPSIIQTYDGGYVITAETWSDDGDVSGNHGSPDAWVFKIDAVGNLLWQKCLGGAGRDGAFSIVESRDEGRGLLVVGSTSSTDGDVSGKHPGTGDSASDVWVVKLNSYDGTIEWQKCFGGSANDGAFSVINTSDLGYAICGHTLSNDGDVTGFHSSKNNADAWVLKLSSSGSLQWQKSLGGTGADVANAILQTSDGGYAIVGSTNSRDGDVSGIHFLDSLQIHTDAWVVKLSPSGKIVRQKCLGGYGTEFAESLLQDNEGNFIIGAGSNSNSGDVTGVHGGSIIDIWIVKLDTSLNIIWEKCYGGSEEDRIHSMTSSGDGKIIIAGQSNSSDGDVVRQHGKYTFDAWIVQLNSTLGVDSWHSDFKAGNFLKIYPNPSESSVKFQILPSQMLTHVELYNLNGHAFFA